MCLQGENTFMALHSRTPPPHLQLLRWNVEILTSVIFGSGSQTVIGHAEISAKSSLRLMIHFRGRSLNMAYRAFRKAEAWIRELLKTHAFLVAEQCEHLIFPTHILLFFCLSDKKRLTDGFVGEIKDPLLTSTPPPK